MRFSFQKKKKKTPKKSDPLTLFFFCYVNLNTVYAITMYIFLKPTIIKMIKISSKCIMISK